MKTLNQLLFEFEISQNFQENDYYVCKSNYFAYEFIKSYPRWEKNCLNIVGDKLSGKTHLTNIFIKKFNGVSISSNEINTSTFNEFLKYKNLIVDNFEKKIEEKKLYSLLNFIDQNNKFLLINSSIPISEIEFKLKDLKSRAKNCLIAKIDKPDDELIYALILKNFSDRQITLDKKIIDFIVKRIERSYEKIFKFIYKIDEISLKKKSSIDYKLIRDVLESE